MAAGPNLASTITDLGSTWTNLSSALTDDGNYASATVSPSLTSALQFTGFGLTLPTDAVVKGIVVEFRAKVANGPGKDQEVKLVKAGSQVGTGKSDGVTYEWGEGDGTPAVKTYGSSTDLWATTWTKSDVEASNFGFTYQGIEDILNSGTFYLDYGKVTVYYSVDQTVTPDLISSASVVRSPQVVSVYRVTPQVIASTSTVPSPSVTPGATTVTPQLVGPTSSVPSPQVTPGAMLVTPEVIASTSTVPSPQVASVYTITPELVDTTQVFEPTLDYTQTVTPDLISSASVVRSPQVVSVYRVTPQVIASTSTVPEPTVTPGATTITPELIATTLVPSPQVVSVYRVTPQVIASTSTVPEPTVTQPVTYRIPLTIPAGTFANDLEGFLLSVKVEIDPDHYTSAVIYYINPTGDELPHELIDDTGAVITSLVRLDISATEDTVFYLQYR